MDPHRLLLEGGLLLVAVALSGILFQTLRLSAIPAFILLGLVLRPLVGDSPVVRLFATIGVVLLLFFMGLEFSLASLLRARRRIVANGVRDFVLCFPIGAIGGWLLGWGALGAMLLGSALYVSSSAIIAKSVIELQRAAYPETEPLLGVLVFEDFAVAFLLALLSGVALSGGDLLPGLLGAARALVFFFIALLVARLGRPLLERLLRTEQDDLFILLAGGVVLLLGWTALRSGLSEAIGAFLAGTLLGETRHRERIETLFAPLQGLFAALFFVSFGLSIDAGEFAHVWLPAILLSAAALITKVATGFWIARREAMSSRGAFSLGLMLVPRGEFSIVFAGVAAAAGFGEAPALIALIVVILTIVGTVGMRHGPALAARLLREESAESLEAQGFDPALAAHPDAPRERKWPAPGGVE